MKFMNQQPYQNHDDQEYRQKNMDDNMDAIDRMRMRPLAWMNIIIVLLNVLLFAVVEITGSSLETNHMLKYGAAYTPYILQDGEYYRLVSSMFLHFGIEHLFNNMLLLFFLGDQLERVVGKFRYLLIYLLGGVGGNILSLVTNVMGDENVVSAGASGAVFAVVGAMIFVLIVNKGRLEELTMIRLVLMATLSLYIGFSSKGVDNAAHVGGLVCGFVLCMLVYRKKAV